MSARAGPVDQPQIYVLHSQLAQGLAQLSGAQRLPVLTGACTSSKLVGVTGHRMVFLFLSKEAINTYEAAPKFCLYENLVPL